MADFIITKTRVLSKYSPDSGVKTVLVTAKGPNPAATGGAVINLSDVFRGEVLSIVGGALGAVEYTAQYVPCKDVAGTSYANQPSRAKVTLFNSSGEVTSGNLSKVVFQLLVVGTDVPVPALPTA